MTTATIMMPLLNEGTQVWRPTNADRQINGAYLIVGPKPDDEDWAFQIGDIVQCESRSFADGSVHLVPTKISK